VIAPFRKIRSTVHDVQRVQDAIASVFNAILKKQILDGRIIKDIFLDSSENPTAVKHGLGKEPRGWIVIKQDASASVYQSTSSTPQATLDLNSSADVTVSLWVF
jgi:hypothetical protein